ncbi:hypothetical protein [Streptomyces sp. B21-083]|uniref:hypothetical protein n=1 Tax=Streptomyces sp. B21-083 TaxID=3039410 RepID=UPI002FF07381
MDRDDEVFTAAVEAVAATIDALEILTLPDLGKLTDAQTRGADCVWSGVTLTPATAVALGERVSPHAGTGVPMRWSPRASRASMPSLAHHTLNCHAPSCERCRADAGSCDIGMALRRLAREYR